MSNQLRVQVNSDEKVYFPDSFGGIDTSNILFSDVGPYTATQDCYAKFAEWSNWSAFFEVYIDDIWIGNLQYIGKRNRDVNVGIFPLKAGQKINALVNGFNTNMIVYGIKY